MEILDANWSITKDACYVAAVLLFGAAIRLGHGFLRSLRHTYDWCGRLWTTTFLKIWARCVLGFGDRARRDIRPDYLYSFFLGLLELGVYPVLMATSSGEAIGGWVTLKTVAQWKVWADDRTTFNLFLITNAAILLIAYLFLKPFVAVNS